jgi:hypothetical protein
MRTLITGFIVALLLATQATAQAKKDTTADAIRILRATPQIQGLKDNDGWGTLIGMLKDSKQREGYVLIPWHIAASSVHVTWYNGAKEDWCKVVKFSEKNDLAVVKVKVPEGIHPVQFADKVLKPNDIVYIADRRKKEFRLHAGEARGYSTMSCSKNQKDRTRRVPADPTDPLSADNTLIVGVRYTGKRGQPKTASNSISGSGIYTTDGKLAAVAWGYDGENIYGVDSDAIQGKLNDWDMMLACNLFASRRVVVERTRFRFKPVPRDVISRPPPSQVQPVDPPRVDPPMPATPQPADPVPPPIPTQPTDPTLPAVPTTPPSSNGDHLEINAKLDEILAVMAQLKDRVELLETRGPPEQLTSIQNTLTNITQVLTTLQGGGQDNGQGSIQLVVTSPPRVDPDYVDVSTLWAIQRTTGISHAVLVVNSEDPEWESTMKPEYERARLKFPTLQLLDVKTSNIRVSPTPQLVIYYVEESGVEPKIINTTQGVYDQLKIFYSN